MPSDVEREIREKVDRCNGTAQLWVHTHYPSTYSDKYKEYINKRGRMMSAIRLENMAIFAMIETGRSWHDGVQGEVLVDYADRYKIRIPNTTLTIPVIPTFKSNSTPMINDNDSLNDEIVSRTRKLLHVSKRHVLDVC